MAISTSFCYLSGIFTFECSEYEKLKDLVVKRDQLILALVRKDQVGCINELGDKAVDDKVRSDDERDARENSHQPGRRLRRGHATG